MARNEVKLSKRECWKLGHKPGEESKIILTIFSLIKHQWYRKCWIKLKTNGKFWLLRQQAETRFKFRTKLNFDKRLGKDDNVEDESEEIAKEFNKARFKRT